MEFLDEYLSDMCASGWDDGRGDQLMNDHGEPSFPIKLFC